MAIRQQQQETQSFTLDALYCEEDQWDEELGLEALEEEDREKPNNINTTNNGKKPPFLLPPLLFNQDLFWEDEELLSLFSKEKQTHPSFYNFESDPSFSLARGEAVEWILKVKSHFGFLALTAILAINYLDRFLSTLLFQKDKPWMIQLVAVTCLSLAAKIEETQVPLLLDLQVEDTEYVFEAKTILKMELLVMSSLQWRMNPVTPLSFLDHIIRRIGLKTHLHWEFFRRCEDLLLSVVADSRFVRHLPSALATATMLHVIQQVEPCNHIEYQNQLLGVLKTSKEKVNDCYQLIVELSNSCFHGQQNPHKRKYEPIPSSPSGVIDAYLSCDNSNDSWAVDSSVSSSPQPLFKKIRVQEQQLQFPSMSRVFLEAVGSPH